MEIREYVTSEGRVPFLEWIDRLRDRSARTKIRVRLDRLLKGNLGDHKSLGHGLHELRIRYGPGYRVYFGREGQTLVLLLCAGNKASQRVDIRLAANYWQDYRRRTDEKKSTLSRKSDSSPD